MNKKIFNFKDGLTALYFGIPTGGEITDDINDWAINHEISYELATIECFESLVTKILNRRDDGKSSYFDLLMCECFRRKVLAPEIGFGIHGEGIKLPVLIFKDTAVVHEPSSQRLNLTSKVVDHFGETFSSEFEFEYLGHQKSNSKEKRTNDNYSNFFKNHDVTYKINNVSHYFDGERFMKVD